MIIPRYLAAFSGHRQLANPAVIDEAIENALTKCLELAGRAGAAVELFSSVAAGADAMAVEAARTLKIPVHVILPKPLVGSSDGFARDFEAEDWKRAEEQINAAAAGVDGGTLRVTRGSQTAAECYYEAGIEMLEGSDFLIAVWDGKPSRGLGGTADVVAHARAIGLPVIVIDAESGQAEAGYENALAGLFSKSEPGRALMEELQAFCGAHATATTSAECSAHLERCSNASSSRFRNNLVDVIKLHGFATFIAAVACILPHSAEWKIPLVALAAVEFFLIGWAVQKTRHLHKNHVHERWIRTRFAAELLRAMQTSGGLIDPLFPAIARHDPLWRRYAVSMGFLVQSERGAAGRRAWQEAKETYVNERLNHPEPRIGQIAYFSDKQKEAEKHFRLAVKWGGGLSKAAGALVLAALVFKLLSLGGGESHSKSHTVFSDVAFRLLPIALPLAAGIFISLRAALDSGRRTYRYREIAEFLKRSAGRIGSLQSEASVRREVAATEEVLLDELIEWRLAEQQNGAH